MQTRQIQAGRFQNKRKVIALFFVTGLVQPLDK